MLKLKKIFIQFFKLFQNFFKNHYFMLINIYHYSFNNIINTITIMLNVKYIK